MELKALEFKLDSVNEAEMSFTGYASTWGLDLGGDIIERGAFSKTLKERGARVKIMREHRDAIGKPVIMKEDDRGLYIEGKISKTPLGLETFELMRDEVLDQMSIGYSVIPGKVDFDEDGTRRIKELKLYEFSVVTFPMNEDAVITGVKSVREALQLGAHFGEKQRAEMAGLLKELTALLKGQEPPEGTHPGQQPPELDELKQLVANFGR